MNTLRSLLIVCAVAVVVSAALMKLQPSKMIPRAEAGEAQSVIVNVEEKSWSDLWYEVQKALPDSVSEDAPTF